MTDESASRILGVVSDMQRLLGVITATLAAESSSVTETPEGPVVVPREGTQPERVLAYLRQRQGRGATRRELRAAFPDMNDNSLSGALTRLKDRGGIEAVGRGRYRVRQ